MSGSVAIRALRHRVVLESANRVPDTGGGFDETWAAVATIWAAIMPRSGVEAFVQAQLAGKVTHEILIRYRTGVGPAMRFRQGTRIFEILAAIDKDERRRWLRCLCEERYL